MRVVILVPRRAGIPDRDRLWEFTSKWWANDFPDWQVVEGHHDVGPFNRSAAINAAARTAGDWDVAVIIDADVLADPNSVKDAVALAYASGRMTIGFHERHHLSDWGTARVMDGFQGSWKSPRMIARTYTDSCSSLVCVRRDLWDAVGGFDEKFVGWGWEDVAFRIACETKAGPMATVAGCLWHLHHTTSHENNQREHTFKANRARAELYKAAHWDWEALSKLLSDEEPAAVVVELPPSRIPRILHRTVPYDTDRQVEAWWEHWRQLLPGWELMTHRDPLAPERWPHTADLWEMCQNGAQRAGLIRLEALYVHGGVYVDSDVEPYRSLEPLIQCSGFAGWEDDKVVPDAVLGAEKGHPAVKVMLDLATLRVVEGKDAWQSGPGVTTDILPGRADWLLLPPGSFYPYHYREKAKRKIDHMVEQPWAFCAHHWAGSWLTDEQRRKISR